MALVTLPHEKRQQIMLIALVAVILIAIVVLYFGFFRSKISPEVTPTSPVGMEGEPGAGIAGEQIEAGESTGALIQEEEFDIDFLFLKDPRFQELKKYGVWPVKLEDIGETGRANPFLPLTIYEGTTEEGLETEEGMEEEGGEEEVEEGEGEEEEILEEGLTDEEIEELLEELLGGESEESEGGTEQEE